MGNLMVRVYDCLSPSTLQIPFLFWVTHLTTDGEGTFPRKRALLLLSVCLLLSLGKVESRRNIPRLFEMRVLSLLFLSCLCGSGLGSDDNSFSGALRTRALDVNLLREFLGRFLKGLIDEARTSPAGGTIIGVGRKGLVEKISRPQSTKMHWPLEPNVGGATLAPKRLLSQPLRVLDGRGKRGRSLKEVEVQGVRLIVGERVPDDPMDKIQTWRNARVIKGVLSPNNPKTITVESVVRGNE